ncbi:MAG TPA: carbonic anhydrase [Candidatus Acidoferrales bacterium]
MVRRGLPAAAWFAFAICFSLAGAAPLFAQAHSSAAHWSYSGPDGPEHWGDLSPAYAACKSGTRQSPINIEGAKPADLPPIHFDYQLSPLAIVNNGHTVQINYAAGSSISIGGKQYSVVQFHFHHPSEEEIAGRRYDLAAHIVHDDGQGRLAVIAILFESGSENPLIHVLWDHLPREIGKEVKVKKVVFNLEDLLPADRGYFTFAGSLSTPPCTEGVTWYVLKQPVEISPAQIAAFAKMYPDNARPLEPANALEILESHARK